MKTTIIKIENANELNKQDIINLEQAAHIIKEGGTVVFPTETVYGLGACATEPEAIRKIFMAKGRPSDNPLIVHISNKKMVEELIKDKNILEEDSYRKLMERFWPGPITIIFQKNKILCDEATAGLDTVGIRMPQNPVALKLIELAGQAIAAPSANTSGKPSPTTAEHVIEDLDGKVDVIIDAGVCDVGVESTVLDMTCETPVILRPGGVNRESIEETLGMEVLMAKDIKDNIESLFIEKFIPKAPGMKYKHYAPKGKLVVFFGDDESVAKKINEMAEISMVNNEKPIILATKQTICYYVDKNSIMWGDRERPETFAKNLYSVLRYCDVQGADVIFTEAVSNKGIGEAVMNRLLKAAGYMVVDLRK